MRKWLLWILMLTLWAPVGAGADLTPTDFAYGIHLDVPPGTAIGALSIPQAVYTTAWRNDLGDLRVFNAAGEPVPHLLRSTRTGEAAAPWRPLPFFPVPADETGTAVDGYRVMVKTGPDGAVVAIDPQGRIAADSPTRTFLVDASRFDTSLAQLRLSWRDDGHNRMSVLRVETSDDLVAWSTVQNRWAVASIRYGGHRLQNDTLTLRTPTRRYLRLRQTDSGPPLVPTRIDGRLQPERGSPVRSFLTAGGTADGDRPGIYYYTLAGSFPIDRVNLRFAQPNSMADALLESRNDSKAPWTRRARGLFYRIDTDGMRLESAPQSVGVVMDRNWRLTVDASESTLGSHVPRLAIGYRPHDLYFIARGQGTFTLAFGSATVQPSTVKMGRLFDGINRQHGEPVERWVQPAGQRFTLGGPRRLVPPPKPLPMRRIMLWSILLAGVLIVAIMAWRLARRMRGA